LSYTVTLKSSGETFTIEGRESILRAGLRAGLNLRHQCMNGSCGGCLAELLEGEIKAFRHSDFNINHPATAFLSCCHIACSDLVLDMPEASEANQIPLQQIKTKVSHLRQIRHDIYELTLKTPRSKVLAFLAGQRATIHLNANTSICIGIASCPCDGMHLHFHIDQRFYPAFADALKKGDQILIEAPQGEFTLNENSKNPLMFIAYETGFAQIQSMLDHVITRDENRQIHLFCLTRSKTGFYYENALRAWRDVLDFFSYEIVYLPDNHFDNFQHFLARMQQRRRDLKHVEIYSVMPADKITLLKQFCLKNGHPDELLKTDQI